MLNPRVAIVKSDFHGNHSTSWTNVWLQYCIENSIQHSLVDWRSYNSFDTLKEFDIILWHFSHYSAEEMIFARNILQALKLSGCTVFPDTGDSDHFDDKVAQSYFLRALQINTPSNYPLHSKSAVEYWIKHIGQFPIVAKLRTGSGSSNVLLLRSPSDLRSYSNKMFNKGFCTRPNIGFKIKSNLSSSKSLADIVRRIKRIPEFYFSWLSSRLRPNERGYVYLQEFVPNVDYDLKVVVVGDCLSFVARYVRKNDFRASGGGTLFYDKSLITKEIIDLAFRASDSLNSDCTGLDIIIDPRSGLPVILEVSYGFSHIAQMELHGYFDRQGHWHNEPLNPPSMLLYNLIKQHTLL